MAFKDPYHPKPCCGSMIAPLVSLVTHPHTVQPQDEAGLVPAQATPAHQVRSAPAQRVSSSP